VLSALGQRDEMHTDDAAIDSKVMLIPIGGNRFKLGVELATRGNIDVALAVNGIPLQD
jgi:lipoyl-dependent peroxiredoxin